MQMSFKIFSGRGGEKKEVSFLIYRVELLFPIISPLWLSSIFLLLDFCNRFHLFISQFFTHRLNVITHLSFRLPLTTLFSIFCIALMHQFFLSLSLAATSHISLPLCLTTLCSVSRVSFFVALVVSWLTRLPLLPLNLGWDSQSFAIEFVLKSRICLRFHILISFPALPRLIFPLSLFQESHCWPLFLQLLPSSAPPSSAGSPHPPSP